MSGIICEKKGKEMFTRGWWDQQCFVWFGDGGTDQKTVTEELAKQAVRQQLSTLSMEHW